MTTPFTVAWDRNGGDGYGVSTEVMPEPGTGLHTVTLRLDRARFAGQGILKTDLAVGARGRHHRALRHPAGAHEHDRGAGGFRRACG